MKCDLEILRKDISSYQVPLSEEEWLTLSAKFTICPFRKRRIIFNQTNICRNILFITDGIAASEHQDDGQKIITRFFKKGDFCTNIVSANNQELAGDTVFAITDIRGIEMPLTFIC